MSGTRPMNELAIRTAVSLSVGLSKVPRMTFPWGTRANPISVGVRGQWAVLADHLQDIHLYLGFDGRQLLVAPGGPSAVVLVNGHQVQGQAWVPVPIPAQIQLGEAQLRVENEAALEGASDNPINSTVDTLFDGGLLRERGRALAAPPPIAPIPAVPMQLAPDGARAAAQLHATLQSAAVPPQAPAVPAADGRRRSQPEPPAVINTLPSTPPPKSITQPPASAKKGAWAEASGPKKAILVLMPFALATMMWVLLDDGEPPSASVPAPPAAAKPASAPPTPTPSRVPARQGFALAKTPARPDSAAPATSPPQDAAPSATALGTSPTADAAPGTPSALPAAPSALPASSASAAPSVPAAPSLAAPALGASPRAALSAALLGNLDQAAELYTKLSEADPSNQAFRLAARLTAAHAVRHP
jgi:hypothetical protein